MPRWLSVGCRETSFGVVSKFCFFVLLDGVYYWLLRRMALGPWCPEEPACDWASGYWPVVDLALAEPSYLRRLYSSLSAHFLVYRQRLQ